MLQHLYSCRSKASLPGAIARSWARRLWAFPALLRLEWNKSRLRAKGASIASTAVCSPAELHGNKLRVGEFCSVGRAYFQAFDNIVIGDRVVINDGATLISGSHDPDATDYRFVTKPIIVKDYAWIAMNATILQGVTIGYGAIVGAGSVVTRSVGDYEIVAGNPARKIRERARVAFDYRPSYWFGPVAAWISTDIFRKPDLE